MKELSSWSLQENTSNGILELRGRRRYSQILSWRSLTMACKRERDEEEEFLLSWVEEEVAGRELLNVGGK